MTDPNLITTIILQGREYLVKMNVINKYLELIVSDKQTGEEWQCSYDHAYIENLTHKTGNFKQFEVFVTMLKSGLLKTSDCVNLELYTFEDLESLRIRKTRQHSTRNFNNSHSNNRRYLILTYSVEFDRINYPLPLEYCGPPDPLVLQATIRKLEGELAKAREELSFRSNRSESKQIFALQRHIDELTRENSELQSEIDQLTRINNCGSRNQVHMLQKAIINLEKSVLSERKSHHKLVEKLRSDKIQLTKELDLVKSSEKSMRLQLERCPKPPGRNPASAKFRGASDQSLQTIYRRPPKTVKSNGDGEKAVRTRSMSPRATKSDGWVMPNNDSRSLKKGKPGSRSSSSSSRSRSRNYNNPDDFHNCETETLADATGRQHKGSRQGNHSRSSSAGSSGSSTTSERLSKRSASSIRDKIRKEKKDFHSLETRISALQKILRDNVTAGGHH